MLLIALYGALNTNGSDTTTVAFFANALSLPQPLTGSREQRRIQQQQSQPQKLPSLQQLKPFVQRQSKAPTTRTIPPLCAAIPFYANDVTEEANPNNNNNNENNNDTNSPAFLIESISRTPFVEGSDEIYKTIANLCIDVFFRELLDPTGKGNVNLLKAWQINYLKNLQAADLERRRDRCPDTNEMFLAYEVRDATGTDAALSQPLLMDDELEGAFNLGGSNNANSNSNCYVRGDLLGFVEITQRSYGLGGASVESPSLLEGLASATTGRKMRPVLTNLAVSKESRKYGIGSRLLEACEEHAFADWKMTEMILEVEDYNDEGLEFYRRRGYEVLFSDPASRRYDIQGFWLNKVRCRRDIMRKPLDGSSGSRRNNRRLLLGNGTPTAGSLADGLLRKIRDTVGNF